MITAKKLYLIPKKQSPCPGPDLARSAADMAADTAAASKVAGIAADIAVAVAPDTAAVVPVDTAAVVPADTAAVVAVAAVQENTVRIAVVPARNCCCLPFFVHILSFIDNTIFRY